MSIFRDPHCSQCGGSLAHPAPRVYTAGGWWCATCLYLHEHEHRADAENDPQPLPNGVRANDN
jgi:hypothetical protein